MRLWTFGIAAIVLALGALSLPVRAQTVDLNLSVQEPSTVARVGDPVTTGVPIPLSAVGSQWKLLDGATEIPLQAKVLGGVRTPWVLLDFRSTQAANTPKTYRLLGSAPAVTPSPALSVTETSTQITVITGPLKVVVKKSTFNLFDQVFVDRVAPFGSFANSERIVNSTSTDNLPLVDAAGVSFAGRGTAIFTWEDAAGLMRRTLRVDGRYGSLSAPLLYYTTRMTFYAGQSYVTVQHVIRNSFPLEERYVKVKSALLRVGSTNTVSARAGGSGSELWVDAFSGKARVELVPPTLSVTTSYPPRLNTTLNVDPNNGMVIGDWSYHGATVCFDFVQSTTDISQQEKANRTARFQNRLMALAPAAWYSDQGAFGSEKFGTYTDEKTSYNAWGWTWPTPGNTRSAEHSGVRPTAAYAPGCSNLNVNDDLEADDPWMHLTMYARTGLRSFLDRADRWARYAKWEYSPRTDGFTYAWNDSWEGPGRAVNRPRVDKPSPASFSSLDNSYVTNNIRPAKDDGLHTWNGGLVDYYYLTGDQDALNAAVDIAERSQRITDWLVPGCTTPYGCYSPGGTSRSQARSYMNFLRVYEGTAGRSDNATWRTDADHVRDLFMQSQHWDARGFFYTPIDQVSPATDGRGNLYTTRFPNGKYLNPWINGIMVQAFYRDWILTGNAALQSHLLAMASFGQQLGSDPSSGFTGDDLVLDSPNPGSFLHLSKDTFRNPPPPPDVPFPYSFPTASNAYIDALTIGYRMTGNCQYLLKAKELWDRSSKGFEGSRVATAAQVGHFQNSMEGRPLDSLLYPENGDLTSTQYLFYEWARYVVPVPPSIADLSGPIGATTTALAWTAPSDGAGGQATEFDLRLSPTIITPANFDAATQVPTPAPGPPGTLHCADVSGLIPCTQYWFAIKTKNSCGTWSALSNVVAGITRCPPSTQEVACVNFVEGGDLSGNEVQMPRTVEFAIAGANPAVRGFAVSYEIPRDHAGQLLVITIHDVGGRRVRELARGAATPGRHTLEWDLRSDAERRVARGVYFARLQIGSEVRSRKVVVTH